MERENYPTDGFFTDVAEAELKPPAWVIEGLLPPGLVFVAGPPKSNKSTLTMAMAALVAGFECRALPEHLSTVRQQGPVLVFSYEAGAGELRHMLEEGMRVKLIANGGILIADDPFGYRLDDPKALDQMLFWLKTRGPKLVILDPLRDFHQLEEKDSGGMNRLLRHLRQWAIDNDAAFVDVHHARQAQEPGAMYTVADMRGTSALFAIADGALILTPRGNSQLHVDATFKRAPAWAKTIVLGAYGAQGQEEITLTDRSVWVLLKQGQGVDAIREALKIRKEAVLESISRLQRNGLAKQEGALKRWAASGSLPEHEAPQQ